MALQSWYRAKYPLGMREWPHERVVDWQKRLSEMSSRPRPWARGPRCRATRPQRRTSHKATRKARRRSELRASAEAYLKKRRQELANL